MDIYDKLSETYGIQDIIKSYLIEYVRNSESLKNHDRLIREMNARIFKYTCSNKNISSIRRYRKYILEMLKTRSYFETLVPLYTSTKTGVIIKKLKICPCFKTINTFGLEISKWPKLYQ